MKIVRNKGRYEHEEVAYTSPELMKIIEEKESVVSPWKQLFLLSLLLMKMIEENEVVVSPEPVSITDDPTCDTNTITVNSPIQSETTGEFSVHAGLRELQI